MWHSPSTVTQRYLHASPDPDIRVAKFWKYHILIDTAAAGRHTHVGMQVSETHILYMDVFAMYIFGCCTLPLFWYILSICAAVLICGLFGYWMKSRDG
jgi:hypothetical protein